MIRLCPLTAAPRNFAPRPRRHAVIGAAATLLVVAGLAACESVPVSGRTRPRLFTSESKEVEMGKSAFAETLASETPSTNAEAIAMVERVGRRIAAVAGRDDYEWEFKLIASPTKNAFCLPGGKVAIYEGILPVCGSEAGLAVVMSHEVGHALARHGGERMNHQAAVSAVGSLGKIVMNRTEALDAQRQQMVMGAYGAASKYGVVLPYSRKHESEADAIGLKLMAEAGYDPSEAPLFWERFSSESGPKPPAFFSTHPSDARRAADLREQLPAAVGIYKRAPEQFGLGEKIPEIRLAGGTVTADASVVPAAQ